MFRAHSRALAAALLAGALSTSGILMVVPGAAHAGVVRPVADGDLHDHDLGEMVDPYADGGPGMDGARLTSRSAARTVSVAPGDGPDFEIPFRCGETWVGSTRGSHSPSRHSIDFNRTGDVGRPVVSSARGVIYRVAHASGYGNYVIVDHGGGYSTLYAHLEATSGVVGQVVDQGSVIGFVGSSGRVTGPHLHFEQRLNGNYFHPYFNRSRFVYDRTVASENCADIPLVGDWDGDGKDDYGIYRPMASGGIASVRAPGLVRVFRWGAAGDVPFVGDWDGNRVDQVGIRRPRSSQFVLRGEDGQPSRATMGGHAYDFPMPGQWTKNRKTGLGIHDPGTHTFIKRMPNLTTRSHRFGSDGDQPVVGDWNGDGRFDVAKFDVATGRWTLRYSGKSVSLRYGQGGDIPVTGDWNGDGTSEIGVWRPSTATFILRVVTRPNTPRATVTQRTIRFGAPRG